jgi:uncharacterized membrane protein YhaH (DUF805 family)
MNFVQAISSVLRNYVGFSGRAARSEYWFWILFVVIVSICLSILDQAVFSDMAAQPLTSIFSLATFLPSLAVAVRRLHDLDRTGWWVLMSLVPLIGWILLLVWFCTQGTPGVNRFGPDPLAGRM